ncbi:sugar diacid recognition domain-containing protein [Aneurinibacillus thermoaerophilus]|nr:sugar diacid recognition domain-containing protein [Aneurinibacillus thermoaerophilus]MED0761561.1 sugar diacid recognition domain-containing protein [Aneurinibacillus thermoaerophilus]MED0764430.1 sugar diacid recognition domain-containing protein [Aneurinibacillus thermoaerophilus]
MYPFTKELAQEIVERTMKILGRNINVMNREGSLLALAIKRELAMFMREHC